MTITSIGFICFCAVLTAVYYLVPKKAQWAVLLAASCAFYLAAGVKSSLFILFTAAVSYGTAFVLESLSKKKKAELSLKKDTAQKEEKDRIKKKYAKERRAVLVLAVLLHTWVLCLFKYLDLFTEIGNALVSLFGGSGSAAAPKLIAPLGISFLTFQMIGYETDVYWERIPAERNPFRLLLFLTFFPQVTQGPISRHEALAPELFREHVYSYERFASGAERMIWGYFKKLAVADVLAPYVSDIFKNYSSYAGITALVGAFFYSVQIYADFSGYMDIMCGFCEVLDIRLTENFNRPYFSKSVAEYWRRWHMSLGEWFKNYIYYPIAMSPTSRKLAKKCKARFGKHFADTLPATIALLVTWLATGLWHGASGSYAAWGLINGFFIIASLWMEPVYAKIRGALHMTDESLPWRFFRVLRTFLLVTCIKVLPEVGTLSDGIGYFRHILTDRAIPKSFSLIVPIAAKKDLLIFVLGVILMFLVSVLQRKQSVRERIRERVPYVLRILLFAVLTVVILFYGGLAGEGGGFMYAQF